MRGSSRPLAHYLSATSAVAALACSSPGTAASRGELGADGSAEAAVPLDGAISPRDRASEAWTEAGGGAGSGGLPGGGGLPDGGGLDASAEAQPPGTACPAALPGPELVFIPADGGPYCIDAREVKQREYGDFLAAADASAANQPPGCAWNDRFDPIPFDPMGTDALAPMGSCPVGVFDPVSNAEQAVRCVDWCDARAYCEWAGKRLCSGVGGRVTLDPIASTERDPTLTEWQYACTGGGRHAYPYGDAYAAGKCVDLKADRTLLDARAGSLTCTGAEAPFDRVRDLVGNVFEWTGNCDASGKNCGYLGGYAFGAEESCAESSGRTYYRRTSPDVGFRCCADAIAP